MKQSFSIFCCYKNAIAFLSLTLSLSDFATASTYQLYYDGIVGPTLLQMHSENSASIIPVDLGKKISNDIRNEVNLLWSEINRSSVNLLKAPDFDGECRSRITSGSISNSILCEFGFASDELSMQLLFKMSVEDHELSIEWDGKESFLVGAQLDITLNAPDTHGREILTNIIPKVDKTIEHFHIIAPSVWNIQARPSPLELLSTRQQISVTDAASINTKNIKYTDSFDKSSLEALILSDQLLSNKKQVAKEKDAQIWQFSRLGSTEPITTSLFIHSKLRYTSSFAGSAHAEAFIHPALISHPKASVVTLISHSPLALVREVLKHKNIEKIVVVTQPELLEFQLEHFPSLNDCSEMNGPGAKCMDSKCIFVADEGIYFDDEGETYVVNSIDLFEVESDAVFMDSALLSFDYMKEVFDIFREDKNAVLVVNSGSMPSPEAVIHEEIEDDDHRANFLRRVTRSMQLGGHEEGTVHVYDEPNAAPLETTFIMVTAADVVESKTYRRFMRRNPSTIDLDIARNMFPSSKSYINTVNYDGPTHFSYTRPSRAWEWWFCKKKPWKDMDGCSIFLPKLLDTNYHVDILEVAVDPLKGRTTKALNDIPEGHILLPHDSAVSLFFDDDHYEYLHNFVKEVPSAVLYKQMLDVIDGYGFQISVQGFGGFVCSTANNTFMNHACNQEVMNAGPLESMSFNEDGMSLNYFDPLTARRPESFGVHTFSLREIKKGEEILMDYRHLRDNDMVRESEAGMCVGNGIIPIDQNENSHVGYHQTPVLDDDDEED